MLEGGRGAGRCSCEGGVPCLCCEADAVLCYLFSLSAPTVRCFLLLLCSSLAQQRRSLLRNFGSESGRGLVPTTT